MKPLKIAILAQLHSPTMTEQLAPRLRERGHSVAIIDLSEVPAKDFESHPVIQSLTQHDIIYYRSGLDASGDTERILKLEALLKDYPVHTINLHYTQHPNAHSKTYEAQQAELHGLLIPKSAYASPKTFEGLTLQLNVPFIAKTNFGTHGTGVHLIDTIETFTKVTESYPNKQLLFQEFIPHDFEYRVHVQAGEAICIWKKSPSAGDFRSNEAQGGTMLAADPQYTEVLTELAKVTFQIFGFEIFVADFMLNTDTGTFYFTEINLNPGWGQTDKIASGIDLIGLTADYFEELCA